MTIRKGLMYGNIPISFNGVAAHYDINLENNLVGLWELDEEAGVVVYDSYSTNNGTNSNCTIDQPGKINKSYFLTSSIASVISYSVSLFDSFPLSFSYWVQVPAGVSRSVWVTNATDSNNYYWGIEYVLDAASGTLAVHYGNGLGNDDTSRRSTYWQLSGGDALDTEWHNIVHTATDIYAANNRLYFDSVELGYSSSDGTATSVDWKPELLYDSCSTGAVSNALNTGYPIQAQSLLTTDAINVTKTAFYLGKFIYQPSGSIVCKFYLHSGSYGFDSRPSGSAIAVSDPIDALTVTSNQGDWKTFTFSTPAELSAASYYCIAVEYSGSVNVLARYNNGGAHTGNRSYYYVAGDFWVTDSRDLNFKIYLTDIVYSFIGRGWEPLQLTNAYLDQAAIWSKSLTSIEVSALYNSGNGIAYLNW